MVWRVIETPHDDVSSLEAMPGINSNMWPALAKLGTSRSNKFLIKLESTVQAICIQYNHSEQSYLEAVELPFNNQGLPWLL